MRAWVEEQRSLAGRMPRRYTSVDEALRRMQAENRHLSTDQARHLTRHGVNQNEDGTYSWKFATGRCRLRRLASTPARHSQSVRGRWTQRLSPDLAGSYTNE